MDDTIDGHFWTCKIVKLTSRYPKIKGNLGQNIGLFIPKVVL